MSAADDDDDDDGPGGLTCFLCKRQAPGDLYDFYAGFCTDYKQTRFFLSNRVRIRATYRDLRRYGVHVCDNCALKARLWSHLPGVLGWGLPALGCGLAAAVLLVTGLAGDQTTNVLCVLALFGGLGGLLSVLSAASLIFPSQSGAVTTAVLRQAKKDPSYIKKGDSFFGPAEYAALFKDAPDQPISAEDILARDRSLRGPEGRKPKRKKKVGQTKPCAFCGAAIPAYAQACPNCKQIIA